MSMSNYIKKIRSLVGSTLIQMPSVTIINFDKAGRLLLIKSRDIGKWVLPGGAIEPYEHPADAAVREMWEETGLVVELASIHGVYGGKEFIVEYPNGDKTSYVTTVFNSRTLGGKLESNDDESTDLGFFSLKEIEKLPVPRWVHMLLPGIFEGKDIALFETPSWKPVH